MRPDHGRGDAHASSETGRDDGIGVGLAHFFYAHFVAARHNPDMRRELFGGETDHQVAAVVAGDGKDALGMSDVGLDQRIVFGGVAV